MIYFAKPESETLYRQHPGLNQSTLKQCRSFEELLTKELDHLQKSDDHYMYYEDKRHFNIGTGVDLLLSYETDKEFRDQFYTTDLDKKPGEKIVSVIQYLFDQYVAEVKARRNLMLDAGGDPLSEDIAVNAEVFTSEAARPLILAAANLHEYQTKWKEETRIAKILEHTYYWEMLCQGFGKKILTQEDYSLILTIVNNIKTMPLYKNLYELCKESKEYHLIFQFPVIWNNPLVNNEESKGLLDIVYLDTVQNVAHILDFKTTSKLVALFPNVILQRGYHVQGRWYQSGLADESSRKAIAELTGYTGTYSVGNVLLIAESTRYPGSPEVFLLDDLIMEAAVEGIKYDHKSKIGDKAIDKEKESYPGIKTYYENWVKFKEFKLQEGKLLTDSEKNLANKFTPLTVKDCI